MTQQEISTEQVIQNINHNDNQCDGKTVQQDATGTVVDEQVCFAENRKDCFQNNLQNNKNDTGLLETVEHKTDDSEVFLRVEDIIKQILSSNGHNKIASIMMLIRTDKQLLYYSGTNFDVLKRLAETAFLVEISERGSNKSVTYESVRDRIVLCLCKLKRNYSFSVLSVLFGMSAKECEDNFYYMIALLSQILKEVIYWPEKKELKETLKMLPQSFLNFLHVRVLHCIEIAVKKPLNCLKCSFCTHSVSKKCSTNKFIVAMIPLGLISFVSQVYGCLVPIQDIIDKSNILEKIDLKKGVIVITNYLGADLKELEKQIKIVKPYVLDTKAQFSDEEKKFNTDFETCYAQINLTIEKFSEFNILNGILPLGMACCINEIAIIISGIINLQDQ